MGWKLWSLQLELQPQPQSRLETGRNAKMQPQSTPGAELFLMQLLLDSRAGSVRPCPWLGPCVLCWRLSQSLTSPFAGSCSFLPATAEPWGPGAGSPGAAHCPPWHRVRNVCASRGSPPKEREKLPPCFSCSSPSPTSVAGNGRVQPSSRLRPSAAGPKPVSVRASKTQ